ncbi:hypothetical protein [Dyella choica]|uniref:Transposase n=1 Tax=Dyella choica TaxID=1927959 RepID=A0A3S0S8D2_9GAMM|nr:hypothetical protein [Dyella choica]RUL72713.1 hypothetical protein EKH80_16890 [Dyella choica]
MTYPRHQIVDPGTEGFFHCVSRCVGRAFLCGEDAYIGRSYEHRRVWVEERMLALAECFAVGLYAYAVMSHHVHVVVRVDPQATKDWSDEEVAERWVRLFSVRVDELVDERLCQENALRLQGNPERMECVFLRCRPPIPHHAGQVFRRMSAGRKPGWLDCA